MPVKKVATTKPKAPAVSIETVRKYLDDMGFQFRMITALEELALNSKDESVRLRAINSLLDRALGRPETVSGVGVAGQQVQIIINDADIHPIDVTPEPVTKPKRLPSKRRSSAESELLDAAVEMELAEFEYSN